MIKSEYGKGVLQGIDLVKDVFVKCVLDHPEHQTGVISVNDVIGYLTTFRKAIETEIERQENEDVV